MNTIEHHLLAVHTDYEAARKAKYADAAWAADTGSTNYQLRNGDTVKLLSSTVGDAHCTVEIAAGAVGTVINARTPRVKAPEDRKPGTYIHFANVNIEIGGVTYRVRVPHNALKIERKPKTPNVCPTCPHGKGLKCGVCFAK